jgi:ABC-type antimicrobial peptide transport system permease subunit
VGHTVEAVNDGSTAFVQAETAVRNFVQNARFYQSFALRVALGAEPSTGRLGVVRQALLWGLPGAFGGVLIAVAMARLFRRFLFGVSTMDPLSFAVAVAAVMATAAIAAYLPARRVTRTDLAAQLR